MASFQTAQWVKAAPMTNSLSSKLNKLASNTAADAGDTRRRYFDAAMEMNVVPVSQGDFYVTGRGDEVLSTVLGSCISACIRDTVRGYGGMNHFLLPDQSNPKDMAGASLRYGSFAMEQLINSIMSKGGRRENLEIKVFGGGNVIRGSMNVGHRNADFIESYLENEELPIAGKHLRGNAPRKLIFYPRTGRVKLRELPIDMAKTVAQKEIAKRVRVERNETNGTIELFD